MDAPTLDRLNALNREFYRRHAASFDETRRSPWDGWRRLTGLLDRDRRNSILDVGCGNGRFGLFLEERLAAPIDYVGVDSSAELLAIADSRGGGRWRLVEADLVAGGLPPEVAGRFDLVACFGVMHHVPGDSARRLLLESMTRRVAPGGYLAVSFWRFGADERFLRRALDWELVGLDGGRVGPHDFLLPWGEARSEGSGAERPLRYCHFVDREEAARLTLGLGLETAAEYLADGASGDLNRYHVLRRPARRRV